MVLHKLTAVAMLALGCGFAAVDGEMARRLTSGARGEGRTAATVTNMIEARGGDAPPSCS